jgi:hypothetical protein
LVTWLSPERLQLASGGAVDHVPPARTQLVANRIRGFEISRSPALDSRLEQSLSFGLIRSFWL